MRTRHTDNPAQQAPLLPLPVSPSPPPPLTPTRKTDIVVIGGGHAGAEAAWAAANLGARVALVTMQASAIGRMSCNPAIGGLGKGQMVREIDALGGLMGLVTDATGIQFRMLNRSKGPAVWAPRAQADREHYAAELRQRLEAHPRITIVEGCVAEILVREETESAVTLPAVCGVTLEDGRTLAAKAVIVTSGTFMGALMHCGPAQTPGGRIGEAAAVGISRCLQSLGFELGRLKTGTPPRVHRDSVDYDACEPQPGDEPPIPFSFMNDAIGQPQVSCWITYTNEQTHEIIRGNLHVAPMYSGQIQSCGPRYCPSIEDKVVRFADKLRHQLFLEPEGRESERIYCNGISTSLPAEVQAAMLKSVPGLREARILQPGYAVEYDFVPTHQTFASLETKRVRRLFVAGQVNGTSGYEEAAGQGLLAGANAALRLDGKPPFVLGRDQAYMGVMIDDLVTRPPTEPYRMFTSRAEYRLHLRSDNADDRLTPLGRQLGLVDDARWSRYAAKSDAVRAARELTQSRSHDGRRVCDWLRRPDLEVADLRRMLAGEAEGYSDAVLQQVLVDAKYAGYLARQERQIERFRNLESLVIPANLDYAAIRELRAEAREKFKSVGPRTLGQAGRISGISPADVTSLWIFMTARHRRDGRGAPPVRDLPRRAAP